MWYHEKTVRLNALENLQAKAGTFPGGGVDPSPCPFSDIVLMVEMDIGLTAASDGALDLNGKR